jgi:hypothetical protein
MRNRHATGLAVGLAGCLGLIAGCSGPAGTTPTAAAATASAVATGATAGVAAEGEDCQQGNLSVQPVAESIPGETQPHVRLVLTNTSPTSCKLDGLADVELVGPNHPAFGPVFQLRSWQADKPPPPLTLRPRDQAHMTILYLEFGPGNEGGPWTPERIAFALPGFKGHRWTVVGWRGKSVLRQDEATHPGTWSGPFMPGATGPVAPSRSG